MSRRALVTLAIGDTFQEMGRSTHPLFKRYADKCHADFVVLDQPKLAHKLGLMTYEKFQVFELLDGRYDQILFVDTDIVVLPTAPSVYELCPADVFAAANEEKYSLSAFHKRETQAQLGAITWANPYFNSGVMLFGPSHRHIFSPDNPLLLKWVNGEANADHVMSDQPILNYLVNASSTKFLDLGPEFNRTRVWTDTHNRFRSHFIHYAGPSGHRYGARLDQIRADAAVASNNLALQISRYAPPLRWVADRANWSYVQYVTAKLLPAKRAGLSSRTS